LPSLFGSCTVKVAVEKQHLTVPALQNTGTVVIPGTAAHCPVGMKTHLTVPALQKPGTVVIPGTATRT